jgi:hypothetical protein
MKKKLTLFLVLSFLILISCSQSNSQTNPKYEKWMNPSYFRGYNILYESAHTFQDFQDFKNFGGNLFNIGTFGWMEVDPPYATLQQNIDGTDLLVNYCRQAGIYYTIAVRSGPGAYDTFIESHDLSIESRIWESSDTEERILYGNMLKNIVSRYSGDSLFVGIVLVVEPRPKVRVIPTNKSEIYKLFLENIFNIHMDAVYSEFASDIRTVDQNIPLILENFAYSTPELFPSYQIDDPYVIYSAHMYMPKEFTNADSEYTMVYPGTYFNLTYLGLKYYDKDFISNTVFSPVKNFGIETGKPVLIGEFGVMYPQIGSGKYIGDVLDLCIENGWHFALWDWRRGSGKEWNIESFQSDTTNPPRTIENDWTAVLRRFHAPPVPVQIYPINDQNNVPLPVTFTWQPLTSYTRFDIEIYEGSQLVDGLHILQGPEYQYNGTLKMGRTYKWRIRSENPGYKFENTSGWSIFQNFTISEEGKNNLAFNRGKVNNELLQNYPNPFNPSTKISYGVKSESHVKLVIYDLIGREVKILVNGFKQPGNYSESFDASNLPSGVYIYKLEVNGKESSDSFTSVKKMILMK